MRTDWKEFAKRNHVEFFVPPQSAIWLAEERTRGLKHAFVEAARKTDWLTAYTYLDNLVVSAYLQGISDTAEALARHEIEIPDNG